MDPTKLAVIVAAVLAAHLINRTLGLDRMLLAA